MNCPGKNADDHQEDDKRFPHARRETWARRAAFDWNVFSPKARERTARRAGSRLISTTVWKVDFDRSSVFFWASQTPARDGNPDHRAGRIQCPVKAKGQSPRFLRHRICHQGIPRRRADAFPTRSAQRTPAISSKCRRCKRRVSIPPKAHTRPLPAIFARPAYQRANREQLQDAGGRFGQAFDQTDDVRFTPSTFARNSGGC